LPADAIRPSQDATVSVYDTLQSAIAAAVSVESLQKEAAGILKAKNQLPTYEAQDIEVLFVKRMNELRSNGQNAELPEASFEPSATAQASAENPTAIEASEAAPTRQRRRASIVKPKSLRVPEKLHRSSEATTSTRENSPFAAKIDKSLLAIGEPRRIRDKAHLRFVATQPCLICNRRPSDAHHLRFAQTRAMGRKNSDQFTVPLCRTHHRENHSFGNERDWWEKVKIDPLDVAHQLWIKRDKS
jgi:hypothetical protein